jgi:hypothetical protein
VIAPDVLAVRSLQLSFLSGPPITVASVTSSIVGDKPLAFTSGLAGLNVVGLESSAPKSASGSAPSEQVIDEAFHSAAGQSGFSTANAASSDVDGLSDGDGSLDAVDELFASLEGELALTL